MKGLLLTGLATLCFAASEPICSLNSLRAVEASINDRIKSNVSDPYNLYAPARGTYLPGYGAVFTVDLDLVVVSPLTFSPFQPTVSDKELAAMHDHKLRKVDPLKAMMRDLMTNACKTLPGLPPGERIVMETFLLNFKWEQARDLPNRITLTANKQQLMDAAERHATPAEMAALFSEEVM